ncbi:3-oxoacyl-[acyl-carrier-protein] synthase-1 [Nitrosospira briensis]|nr:3-oxoacyl-[acyl-carrier-protein] synthase-1 [Nitrosospira briensis]
MVSSVGLTAPSSCAAIRAGISNPTETRCRDSQDEWIIAHQVPFEKPWRGLSKLTRMAVSAIEECLALAWPIDWSRLPVLLCSSERSRPGRVDGIDDRLLHDIAEELGVGFSPEAALFCHGRTGIAVALMHARKLIYSQGVERVLIVTTDTLVTRRTLAHYERNHRLLTPTNSNGFMPGEGACAFLVGRPTGQRQLICAGIGFDVEAAHIDSGAPLRGDGLVHAHKAALADCGRSMDDVDYRVTDLGGEHYYFKEAHLAFTRLRRQATDTELWHPAQCTGAGGAALGGVCLAVVHAALERGYAPGATALLHFSDDDGERASIVCTVG